ncbi:MAG: protein TolR [Deltaproteobacteria bacterium]|nr:protein TolR [Deltaproteobacteria bacterium]MBW2265981.1 protein TolR [Deltaproteobacteria bacterium]MBW2317255.1 protein TolR [Deltaproteobacteria bacterium]MBW2600985.1 protein TolR [Deltaproteobacteria bacterium]
MAMGGNNSPFMSEINVTPLVDVMLVLLIIFMVTAPMMMQGVNVSLPQTTSKPLPAEKEHLTITVDRSQQIFINDYKVALEALQEKMTKILEGRQDHKVYLRADENVPYGVVIRVISAVKNAGVEKLGVVTEPLKEKVKKK